MDIRDLVFWGKEAQRKVILGQMRAIQAARVAMDPGNGYRAAIKDLEGQLYSLDAGRSNVVRHAWETLKRIGRR